MKILLSGSKGLVGRALKDFLESEGHEVVPLVRNRNEEGVFWNPEKGELNKEDFEGFDAVIHLAGESITGKRWSHQQKKALFMSRCRDTWLLSQVLTRLYRPPLTVITASAVGFYGDRGDEVLTETSCPGAGFLAHICKEWEGSTESIGNRGSRVVHTRFGAILSKKGGMLAKLLPTFRLGLGGRLGSGEQFLSWVALEDVVRAIDFILHHPELEGAVNVTSPHPVRQAEFVKTLAHALHRPALLPLPAWLLKLVLGEMAGEVLLASTRAVPSRLTQAGFLFQSSNLRQTLKKLLG
jgi:uncharacterized protein (TIGR01777 family)